jgi:chitodextrinase
MDLPPSAPTNLKLVSSTSNEISIAWTPSTDDHGIANYEIRRNGVFIGSSPAQKTSFVDTGLSSNTSYIYTVRAVDTIGHRSSFSTTLPAKTLPGTNSSSSSGNKSSSSPSSKNNSSTQSSPNSKSSRSSISSANNSSINNKLSLEWRTPTQRENGEYLELNEIGGFELRHQLLGSSTYTSILITGSSTTSYAVAYSTLADNYEIAAFDVNGLYSRFIKLTPH